MLARREPIIEAIHHQIAVTVKPRGDLSTEELHAFVPSLVDLHLRALSENHGELVNLWLAEQHKASLLTAHLADTAVKVITITRSCFLREARPALEQAMVGALEGLYVVSTVSDELITALTSKALDAFREETRYQALYLRTPAILQSIDSTGSLLTVSDKWLAVFGFTREEVIGKKVVSLLTESSRRSCFEVGFPALYRDGHVYDVELEFVKKNGEIMDVLLSSVLERDESGKPLRTLAVLVDVTEQRKVERALRESEASYRTLVDSSPIGIAVHREGKILYMNPTAVRLMGAKSADELIGTDARDLIHEDSREIAKARMALVATGGGMADMIEEKFVRVDGTVMNVEVAGMAILYEGAPASQVVFIDVSDRKKSEEARSRSAIQEEVIRMQEEALRALSTPLIPVSDQVIVMPLVGTIDPGRAERILEALLHGVTTHRAAFAILDVTGVPVLDTTVAHALARSTRAVRLLGAQAVLTGISPSSAQTLMQAGADLKGLVTRATLKDGISYAVRRIWGADE